NCCKKLLAQLPGQAHPTHKHEIKEETFHVLWGSMDGVLDGKSYHLDTGDTLLVKAGQWHSFSTKTGVIFEEISTTSISGDSVYEDDAINKMGKDERKSTFAHWFADLPERVQRHDAEKKRTAAA